MPETLSLLNYESSDDEHELVFDLTNNNKTDPMIKIEDFEEDSPLLENQRCLLIACY